MATAPPASTSPMRAGGRATEAGMAFQAGVATWFAAHLLARLPVGSRFGIDGTALPVTLRLETGDGLDDIEVAQADGGAIHIQCKTNATLAAGDRTPLSKTVGQLARLVADAKAASGLPDLTSNVGLLAVRSEAARTLDHLNAGCRAFDLGGDWVTTKAQRNQNERGALDSFETIAVTAWTDHRGTAPADGDLADMARFFRVARFSMDEGDVDWREASRLIGRRLYGNEAAGDAPLRDLKAIMRGLIGSGAPANRAGLLRALRARGHVDIGAAGYETDIQRLRDATVAELARLAAHGRLPLNGGIPITRSSDAPLVTAIRNGSMLVVGEPGAGKTGALVHAAATLAAAGDTVLFLSVDRFPGVAIAADLASELRLAHALPDILAAFPGAGSKILIIDALDAARGGPSENVFARLIEEVRADLSEDWTIVSSIRTFDLKNGRRFRQAFAGAPPDPNYTEPGLAAVRHFLVPRLTETDVAAAGAAAPALGTLLASAPPSLATLLRNIFNLSLAAELLADGTDPAAFGAIRTQSGLIDAYEDLRLDSTTLQAAAAAAAATMAARRRLAVRKVAVGHASLDAVIQTGVLTESGDLVSFAHHVLFDHITGRFHLAWDDPPALLAQLAGDTSSALLLAPALRFAVERLWRSDQPGRPQSWALVEGIFSAPEVDPVLANVALRILVDNIVDEQDISGLIAILAARSSATGVASLAGRFARFAAMDVEASGTIALPRAVAWARVAATAIATRERMMVDPARILLHALFEKADLADPVLGPIFGVAGRALLRFAWDSDPPLGITATNAIRFVAKSFASDPAASRALLDPMLREPHFSAHADREANWLAEQIRPIAHADPAFVVEIYAALFGQTINDDATSWLGGQPSRILPLSSNRRQDFNHCRWQLGTAMGEVLTISAEHGTRALIDGTIGKAMTSGYGGSYEPELINLGGKTIELRGHDIEVNAWEETDPDDHRRDDDMLAHYATFLRGCTVEAFADSVAAASRDYATAAIWARILGVGSKRVADIGDLLWPLLEQPDLLENTDILRDAVRFVAAAWPSRSVEERTRFETMALEDNRFGAENDRLRWRRILGRVLALLPEDELVLEATRSLRREIEAEDGLRENLPLHSITTRWGENGDWERDDLRRAGVNIDDGPDAELLTLSDALYAHVERTPSESAPSGLAALWSDAMAVVALIDAHAEGLHPRIDRSAWGHVANAVERIASSPHYAPGTADLPTLEAMFAMLARLSASRYPEPRESGQ